MITPQQSKFKSDCFTGYILLMKNVLDCRSIVKENPKVLSWNDDIHLLHYTHQKDIKQADIWVHMNMISIVLHGETEIYDQGSKSIVPAGTGFFAKKGSYFGDEKVDNPDAGYEAILIFFSDEWLRSEVENIFTDIKNMPPVFSNENNTEVALIPEDELLAALIVQLKYFLSLNGDPERMESLLPMKIRELFQILISAPHGQHFEKQLRSIDTFVNPELVGLMQRYYKENISQEKYASLANVSVSTFKRKFTQTFKMNTCDWIMQRRLEEAYRLLRSSQMNITEIGYEVGFETPAHFISSFKERYGSTPKQLQQKILNPSKH